MLSVEILLESKNELFLYMIYILNKIRKQLA